LFKTLSITPIIGVLLNLPPDVRYSFSNTYLIGFAFGKIDYSMMLTPILKSWAIASHGVAVKYTGKEVYSKNIIMYVDSDMRAKGPLQNLIQAPGHYACDCCEVAGETAVGSIRYMVKSIYDFDTYRIRTEERWNQCAQKGTAAEPYFGVKGQSVMKLLPYFLVSEGFVIQPLHLLWEK